MVVESAVCVCMNALVSWHRASIQCNVYECAMQLYKNQSVNSIPFGNGVNYLLRITIDQQQPHDDHDVVAIVTLGLQNLFVAAKTKMKNNVRIVFIAIPFNYNSNMPHMHSPPILLFYDILMHETSFSMRFFSSFFHSRIVIAILLQRNSKHKSLAFFFFFVDENISWHSRNRKVINPFSAENHIVEFLCHAKFPSFFDGVVSSIQIHMKHSAGYGTRTHSLAFNA